jgi:hypothetical protein
MARESRAYRPDVAQRLERVPLHLAFAMERSTPTAKRRGKRLPEHLQAQLHAAGSDSGAGDGAEGCALGVDVSAAELRVVQRIKGFPAELSGEALCHFEILEHAEIPVIKTGLLISIAAGIANDANAISLCVSGEVECAGVPVAVGKRASRVGIADQLRDGAREAADEDPV